MNKKLLLALLLILTIKSFSQDSKFSIEASYPLPIDDNFIGKNYSGIIDIGAKYRFLDLNIINLGASFNGGVLLNNSNKNNGLQDFKVTSYSIQPKIFVELDMESITKFHPFVGLGYTLMIFDPSGTNNGLDVSGESDTQSGINANFGIAYDITEKLFAQIQYDFVKLGVENEVPDIKFNRNVNILKIGLGFRL
ncbi:outer membrane protein [Aquimarina sp. M1]